jgi:hypothetical protein
MKSKSFLRNQNDTACKPEQKVRARERRANFFHRLFFLENKIIVVIPVKDTHISSGKKDQFQADIIGLV